MWRPLVVVFLGTLLCRTEGFSLTFGLMSLGVASLTGLKLHFSVKMFGPKFRASRDGYSEDILQNLGSSSKEGYPEYSSKNPEAEHKGQGLELDLNLTLPEPSEPKYRERVRRDAPGGIKLSKGLLRWLRSIDHHKCIHRFFCELGVNQSRFGNLGQMTTILISMGGLPKHSWAQEMFDAGQAGMPCPKTCNEHELSKTVDYLDRHLFAPPPAQSDSDLKENEIAT